MGASTFYDVVRRKSFRVTPPYDRFQYEDWPSAEKAFDHLANEDRYENGHSYSGGIGMKHDFKVIATVKDYTAAQVLADKLLDDNDPRVSDKWDSPAGCIAIEEGDVQFLFFGVAPS